MPQCTTGAIPNMGPKFEIKYSRNNSWDARRDSLGGGGETHISAAHLLNDVLDTPLAETGSGDSKVITYMTLDYLMYEPLSSGFTDDLLDRTQPFSLKLHIFAQSLKLIDDAGLPFYTDNENPYVDIRLYPSDNWADVVAAYVRKGAEKESMMALRARTGDTRVDSNFFAS